MTSPAGRLRIGPACGYVIIRTRREGLAAKVGHGIERPLRLDVVGEDADRYRGSATVTQSAFGIKPYSGMFGTLKVRDAVQVEFDVDLGVAERVPR